MQPSPTAPRHGISVIMPCLNEEESIGRTIDIALEGIRRVGLEGEIIVVDNGCTDQSVAIALEHGARVVEEPNRGYGSALRRGFASAHYDIMVMGDADLTYDFSRMDVLVRPILDDGFDFSIGNRLKNIQPGSMPILHRYIGNPLLSTALRMMFRKNNIQDAHCGFRAIRKDAYERLQCVTTGMEFASEMVVRAVDHRLKIFQHDIEYHPRVGDSKLRSFQDGWRHLRYMMLHSPTTMLLVPGGFFWFLGLAISLRLAFGPVIIDGRHIDIHCMIMGGLLSIVSLQIITIGLLAKAYAHLSGLRFDPVVAWFYRWFTFEKAFLLSVPMVLAGLVVSAVVVWDWAHHGFGDLDKARPLFLALLCLVSGVQVAAASYVFSIMALPRHIDVLPPQATRTGVVDL